MNKQPGIIYETNKGEFAIAYHHEQHESFKAINKVYIHLFTDSFCDRPLTDKNGKKLVKLKSVDKLKLIGFSD